VTASDAHLGRPHLFLVGMMGVGKTTVGRRAAERLGWRFVDADAAIEARVGCSVREVFAREGETGFRDLESRVLADLLDDDDPSVIAAGGGAVLREENRLHARARAEVVWLRARPETLLLRLGGRTDSRPMLDGDPVAAVRRLASERESAYAAAAHHVIDVDQLTAEQTVTALAELALR
jgi:shikimate kinase